MQQLMVTPFSLNTSHAPNASASTGVTGLVLKTSDGLNRFRTVILILFIFAIKTPRHFVIRFLVFKNGY